MRVLGLNYHEDRSSAVSVHNQRVVGGLLTSSTEFPRSLVAELSDPHQPFDYVVTTSNRSFSEFKLLTKAYTKTEPVVVDYREALAMSSIVMRDWDSCAVMIVDGYYCALGYYANSEFHWIREFSYPNSISLFYSAATRLLGFDPITEEHKTVEASEQGSPTYADLIEQQFVNVGDGDYTLLHNLEHGVGRGPLNLDIASSVQAVFDKIILSLAGWLSRHVKNKKLAYAGRASANYLTNTRLANSGYFNELSIQPLTSAAGAAIGSASLISRPIWDRIDIGAETTMPITPEQLAAQLIKGNIIAYNNNRAEFTDRSTINRNWLAIPFKPVIDTFRQQAGLTYTWQQPYTICQEKDYSLYYPNSNFNSMYGQFASRSLTSTINSSKVVTTNLNRNPFMNRVLELTRAEGYPILISSPIESVQ
jgi:predicted NodU family carbamoyl transferase